MFEGLCLAIVALYFAVEGPRGGWTFARRAAVIVAGSWLAEDTCIRLYGFYDYAPTWSVFADRVPVLVLLIWAPVVLSAWALARHLRPAGRSAALGTAALVFADAWLVEPIAVASGLWHWNVPGLFDVPVVGVLGWAMYAGAAVALFEALDRRRASSWTDVLVAPGAALATHAMLLAAWWGGLRWVSGPVPAWPAVALAAVASVVLSAWAVRRRARERVPFATLAVRIPAALLFFGLLARHGREDPALVAWALAFAPPYLVLTPWRALKRAPRPEQAT